MCKSYYAEQKTKKILLVWVTDLTLCWFLGKPIRNPNYSPLIFLVSYLDQIGNAPVLDEAFNTVGLSFKTKEKSEHRYFVNFLEASWYSLHGNLPGTVNERKPKYSQNQCKKLRCH